MATAEEMTSVSMKKSSTLPVESKAKEGEDKRKQITVKGRGENFSPMSRGLAKRMRGEAPEEKAEEQRLENEAKGVAVAAAVTPNDVEQLIQEAQTAAGMHDTGDHTDSHTQFHRTVAALLREPSSKTLGGFSEAIHCILMMCESSSADRPQPTAGRQDIFPLPVPVCDDGPTTKGRFLKALVTSLNSLNGQGMHGVSTSATRRVQKRLMKVVEDCTLLDEPLPSLNFEEFFRTRGVDYQGDEIKLARRISWDEIAPSLPSEVGMIDVRQFCHGGIRHYIDNFENFLVPSEEMVIGRTPDVMIQDGQWEQVVQGLLTTGVCEVLPLSKVYHVNGKPLLSGMFSVSKQEFVGDVEVCRLIMNLKPVNRLCRSLTGDTGTLPSIHTMGAFYLKDSELLCISSEDIRCFFYLFRTPKDWWPFMAFGRQVPSHLLPNDFPPEPGYLCSRVLPMGFLNSVAVAQHVHRSVVQQCMGAFPQGLGAQDELRRDRFFPQGSNLYRVYLDNYDQLEKCDQELAMLIQGTPTEVVQQLRETYAASGLPRRPKKSVERSFCAEVQGAWMDGVRGTCGAKPSKVVKYAALALELVSRGTASQRELQVVAGGLVYIAMFRRPLLPGLNSVWRAIVERESLSAYQRSPISPSVVRELVRFVGLLPLAEMDFRCPFDQNVTATDASTTGGGLCVSRGLSPYGLAASLSEVRGDVPEVEDFCQVLSIGLFDGVGALRLALDVLGLPIAGHISVEQNDSATRVVQSFFPEVVVVNDVKEVTAELVLQWSAQFSNVGVIVLGGGPPCQGVSGLNFDKKGALRDSRSVLFKEIPRAKQLLQKFFPWAQIHELVENVASMSFEDCEIMCTEFDNWPWFIDSNGVSLCHRPRLYWVSWELLDNEGVAFVSGSDGRLPIVGEVQLSAKLNSKVYLEAGWDMPKGKSLPTFTTSRPSPTPLRRPAGIATCSAEELSRWREDLHRFPPYQYRSDNCLQHSSQPPRIANLREREAIMGFPIGYTKQCMKKSAHNTVAHSDCRLTLIGNSWSVPVVAWLLGNLFHVLGFIPLYSPQQIVDRLAPGSARGLQSLLLRPPLHQATSTAPSSSLLVQKLSGLVSLKGEDLMLQAQGDVPTKFHRLRTSVPAGLWRWRTISGWRWKGSGDHINVLELRAVFTSVRWRALQLHQQKVRYVHLVDSLVVLHSLARGRSSSKKMRRTLMRLSSYLLACGLFPIWGYVDTHQNPADRPSRRGVKKKWAKKA